MNLETNYSIIMADSIKEIEEARLNHSNIKELEIDALKAQSAELERILRIQRRVITAQEELIASLRAKQNT